MRELPQIGARRGLRYVLLSQLVLAALLMGSQLVGLLPELTRERTALPDSPVSPGDQQREFNPRRLGPAFLTTDGPTDVELPASFPTRLRFEEQTLEGFGRTLLLIGEIGEGDAERFAEHLAALEEPPDFVALHSPGGRVGEALDIGQQVRTADLKTAVMPSAFCASSCPYILAAGVERHVSRQGAVGVHQHYYETPGYMPVMFAVEDIQRGQGATMQYLVDMGIDPKLMIFALKTPPAQIYVLVKDELLETALATELTD